MVADSPRFEQCASLHYPNETNITILNQLALEKSSRDDDKNSLSPDTLDPNYNSCSMQVEKLELVLPVNYLTSSYITIPVVEKFTKDQNLCCCTDLSRFNRQLKVRVMELYALWRTLHTRVHAVVSTHTRTRTHTHPLKSTDSWPLIDSIASTIW